MAPRPSARCSLSGKQQLPTRQILSQSPLQNTFDIEQTVNRDSQPDCSGDPGLDGFRPARSPNASSWRLRGHRSPGSKGRPSRSPSDAQSCLRNGQRCRRHMHEPIAGNIAEPMVGAKAYVCLGQSSPVNLLVSAQNEMCERTLFSSTDNRADARRSNCGLSVPHGKPMTFHSAYLALHYQLSCFLFEITVR